MHYYGLYGCEVDMDKVFTEADNNWSDGSESDSDGADIEQL